MIERLARRLPARALRPVAWGHRLSRVRLSRRIHAWRRHIEETESWSAERLAEYQLGRLQAVTAHAKSMAPFYGAALPEAEELRSLDDVARLPLLTKSDLQEHAEELVAGDVSPDARQYATTGGSTGTPVGFWFDSIESVAAETAFMAKQWERVGYRTGDRNAVLRGEVVEGGERWEIRPFENQLFMSSYRLTDDELPFYIERLRSFRPRFLQAYPSSVSIMARFMLENREPPLERLEAVLCGSENIYDWQREQIEEAFGARAFSWYGLSERVCLAGECEGDRSLHVFPQYSLTELVDPSGRPIDEPGRIGEIVGTGFTNRSMPLIRYRTMDAAAWADGPCPSCGRPYRRLQRVEGRLQEFMVSSSGRPVSMTAINMHSPVFDNVRQFRFVQETPGRVLLRVVPGPHYSQESDEARIRSELAPKLGDIELMAVEPVDEIAATPSGKFRFLDQHLPIELGDS